MKFWLADERILVDDPRPEAPERAFAQSPQVEVEIFDENGHPIGKFKADRNDFKRLAAAL